MSLALARSVLQHARVVRHDSVTAQPLTFSSGLVTGEQSGSFQLDLSDHLVFPGLINAHDHLHLNNVPRITHAAPYTNSYDWIDDIESRRSNVDLASATTASLGTRHWHGALKNLLAGVTTVAHHDPGHSIFDEPAFPVSVVRRFGWAHSLRLGTMPDGGRPRYGPPVVGGFRETSRDVPWIIHLAEGTDDVAAGELEQLDALGCLASNSVIVHGVGLRGSDVARIIDRGASVVWCPASNLELFGHTLDARRLFDANCLTLGTDSRLTGSRDLLAELRVAAAHSDLLAAELLRLVTIAASAVLRIPEFGGLGPAQRADCVILRDRGDPHRALLQADRASIRAVVRGGVPTIADQDFAPWFAHCGVAVVPVRLDGRDKLLARSLARPDAIAMERGLELA